MKQSICFWTVSHPMYGLGGAEVMTYQYASEFARNGWRVFFFTKSGVKITDDFDDKHIEVITYSKKNSLRIYFKFFRLMIIEKINVVFFRNNTIALGVLALFQNLLNYKLIWSVKHDDKCGKYASTEKLRKYWNESIPILKRVKYFLMDKVFRYGVQHAHIILAQNNFQKDTIFSVFKKSSIINYSSTHIPCYNLKRENIILFIATMKDFKRPHLFCEIAGEYSKSSYNFKIIGKNFIDSKKSITLLENMKLNNVEYLGQLELEEVRQYLDKSKLLINTSSAEGFPNTFVQAFSHGVPVITLGVNPDNLIDNYNLGFVCKNKNSEVIQKINLLMEDKNLWNNYSQSCYNYSKEHLDITKNIKILMNIFLKQAI